MDGYKSLSGSAAYTQPAPAVPSSGVTLRLQELRECCAALDQTQITADRAATRVAGSEPEANSSGGKPMPVPNGLGDDLGEIIDRLRSRIESLNRPLSRIELALG